MNQKITEVLAEMREWDFNCGAERNPYARPDRDDVMGWADEIEQALAAKDADGVRYEEDAYVIGEMGGLLAQIAVIVNGPAPELVYWRYHDLPEKVQALKDCASQQPEVADAARVIEWARDPNRKAATQAFTAGADRQAAYWIEWAESQSADHVADGGCTFDGNEPCPSCPHAVSALSRCKLLQDELRLSAAPDAKEGE